jgi:hypothetical protein
MQLSGDPYVIIGVLNESPNARVLEPNPEVWTPFQLDPNSSDQGNYFQVLGRLKPGVTLEKANARMKIGARIPIAAFGRASVGSSFGVGQFRTYSSAACVRLVTLVVAVTFVLLLIACANVLPAARAAPQARMACGRAGRRTRPHPSPVAHQRSIMLSVAARISGSLGASSASARSSINTAGLPLVGIDGAAVGIVARRALHALVSIGTASCSVSFALRLASGSGHQSEESADDQAWIQAEQSAVGAGRWRNRACAHPARRFSAPDPHDAGAAQ